MLHESCKSDSDAIARAKREYHKAMQGLRPSSQNETYWTEEDRVARDRIVQASKHLKEVYSDEKEAPEKARRTELPSGLMMFRQSGDQYHLEGAEEPPSKSPKPRSTKQLAAMKFTAKTADFLTAISEAMLAVKGRISLPALGCLKITAEGKRLIVMGSNLEQYIRSETDCKTKSDGEACIPGAQLAAVMQNINAESVSIELQDDGRVKIEGGANVFHLPMVDVKEFSKFPEHDEYFNTWTCKPAALLTALRVVFPSIYTDSDNYSLGGVNFTFNGKGNAELAATNRRILAVAQLAVDDDGEEIEANFILPRECVSQIMRGITGKDSVAINLSESLLSFRSGMTEIFTRLLADKYPNYKAVIPDNRPGRAVVNRVTLIDELQRVASIGSPMAGEQAPVLTFKDGRLTIDLNSGEFGRAFGAVELEPAEMGLYSLVAKLSHQYIMAAIGKLDSRLVRFEWSDDPFPRIAITHDSGFLAVINAIRDTSVELAKAA